MVGIKYKNGTEECKNIQLRFIDSCRFMASSLDKQTVFDKQSMWYKWIQCDKYKGNMELITDMELHRWGVTDVEQKRQKT